MNKKYLTTMSYYCTMLFEFTKLFFDMSTIHGFPQISQEGRNIFERFLWVTFVGLAVYGSSILSQLTLTRYQENPTVISIERDRFEWNTSFPTATICPHSKYDSNKLEKYLKDNNSIKNKTLYKEFIISLSQATYLNFDTVVDYENTPGEEFSKLMFKFHFDFKADITNSAGNIRYIQMEQTFTEMGMCYSFNSHLAVYNSPAYWNTGSWKLLPEKQIFYINPLDGEVFVNVINMTSGYMAYFHDPHEIIDVASKKLTSDSDEFMQLSLSGMNIYASERTKSLSAKQRKCRFYYESNLSHFPMYSFVACRMECRANLAKKMCGCIPHFYRNLEGEKVCDVKGLHCLAKHRENLIFLKNQCSCVANCDETVYVVDNSDKRTWFLGTNLQWGMVEYPKIRLKRDVIFGFSDLIVYIGGMTGLFLGCSVLSFIEILYFFTLRLFWFIKSYRKIERLQH